MLLLLLLGAAIGGFLRLLDTRRLEARWNGEAGWNGMQVLAVAGAAGNLNVECEHWANVPTPGAASQRCAALRASYWRCLFGACRAKEASASSICGCPAT